MKNIDELTRHYEEIWKNCNYSFPELGNQYTSTHQKENELGFEEIIQSLKARSNRKKINGFLTNENEPTSAILFRRLFVSVFGFEDSQLDLILSPDFKNVTKEFIKKARDFDKELDLDDIFQACRNAWIMMGLQVMMDLEVELTPSIFAYSMLYPYSDNFLDDPKFTRQEKIAFSMRFHNRLKGVEENPKSNNEKIIFNLIEMIEGQFDREMFPSVYKSLLAIHHAQTKSLALVNKEPTLSENEIMKICIEKGGTSVLADGFLVAGDLTEDQQISLYGYGTYLQFIDDIQDVKEDSKACQMTIFSNESKKHKLDSLANKTFCLGKHVIGTMKCFGGERIAEFQNLIEKSINSMLIETILLNEVYFSDPYIQEMALFSPLSIDYLIKRRSKISTQRISYIKNIVESSISNF